MSVVLQLTSLVMAEGSSFSLGLRISRERTVSISKSFRPSLLVSGLKQQPPDHRYGIKVVIHWIYAMYWLRLMAYEMRISTCGIADSVKCVVGYVAEQDGIHNDVGFDQIYCNGFSSCRRPVWAMSHTALQPKTIVLNIQFYLQLVYQTHLYEH